MKSTLLLFILFFGLTVANAQSAYDEPAEVPHKYYELSLKFIKETPGFTPPVASRTLGYIGLCLYESVVHGLQDYKSLEGRLPDLQGLPQPENAPYNWSIVANNAMAFVMDSLFDNKSLDNKILLYAARTDFNIALQAQVSTDVYERSVAYGEAIGQAIFEYSKTESGYRGQYKNFPASYVPPSGIEHWVALPNQVALQPYWAENRAFMPENVELGTLPPPPPSFSTDELSVFYAYSNQVYQTGLNLTQSQKDIASFWADAGGTFTPPGHSLSIMRQLLRNEAWDLGNSAVAYAKLGLALSDAFLACWKSKYIHNLCRPVTYIRSHIDANWSPYIATPPFPEYPSGHSSQSGAWGVVMTDVFGDDYDFTDSTYAATLGVRSFTDFKSCAEETALSRLYGGIHFEFGNLNGSYMGQTIGANVLRLFDQVASTQPVAAKKAELELYPNPALNRVFIKNTSLTPTTANIISTTGQIIQSEPIVGNSLNLNGVNPGLYIVMFYGKNGMLISQEKLVVQ